MLREAKTQLKKPRNNGSKVTGGGRGEGKSGRTRLDVSGLMHSPRHSPGSPGKGNEKALFSSPAPVIL